MNSGPEYSRMLKVLAQKIRDTLEEHHMPQGVCYKTCAKVNGKQYLIRSETDMTPNRERTFKIEMEELPSS